MILQYLHVHFNIQQHENFHYIAKNSWLWDKSPCISILFLFYFLTTCVLLLITHHSYNSALRPILIPDINEVYILKIYMLIMKAFRMLILNMALVLIKFILKMCIILNDTSLITNTMYHYDTFEAPIYNSLFQTRIIHM